jgi:enterochelin esterase-like enzyme
MSLMYAVVHGRVSAHYPVSSDPQDRAFGGSSFGGIAALVAGMRGAEKCGFGSLIVESPSLWIGDPEPETFLKVSCFHQ